MPTCFVVANKLDIVHMQNLDDVYRYLEKHDQMVGGSNLEEIVALSEVVLGEKLTPSLFKETSDETQFYLFDSELWQRLAALEHEDLLDLSVPWSETEHWRNREHNRMDLAGFLLELGALLKRTLEENNSLYVVVEGK